MGKPSPLPYFAIYQIIPDYQVLSEHQNVSIQPQIHHDRYVKPVSVLPVFLYFVPATHEATSRLIF